MKREKLDIAKVLAILAQPREIPAPLKNVEIRRIEIPYITNKNQVEKRPIKLFLPNEAAKPIPLIYVAHYEMSEDAMELRAYLKKGWAVASVSQFEDKYNGQSTDDDLVFNSAALYTLRHSAEIDNNRVAVVGGSAGGYTALMLNALQLGICCSVAYSAVNNIYFNYYKYFQKAGRLNAKVFAEMSLEERKNIIGNLDKLPIPFLAVSGLFQPILQNFPNPNDMERWEAFSPVALAEMFCNPILMTHVTSDILVPIDQFSKRFTYDKPGTSLPEDFCHRLPEDIKGKLKYSLEERLPKTETRTECLPAPDANLDFILPFDTEKRFNLVVFDEGPVESYASHRIQPGTGIADDTPYLEKMFAQTAAKTNVLTLEKLQLLLERYQAKSVQLPAHVDIDDSVYGSLEIYRKEVCEELSKWKNDNGENTLEQLFAKLLATENEVVRRNDLQYTIEIVKKLI